MWPLINKWGGTAFSWLTGGIGTKVLLGALGAAVAVIWWQGYSLERAQEKQATAEAYADVAESQNAALAAGLEQLHAAKRRQAEAYEANKRELLDLQAENTRAKREIDDAPDPSGCADQPVTPAIRSLLND